MRHVTLAAACGVTLALALAACASGSVQRPTPEPPHPTAAPSGPWCTWWAPITVPVSAAAADPRTGRVPAALGFRPDDPPFPPGLAPGTEVEVFGFSSRWVLARMALASLTGAGGYVPLYLPRGAIAAELPCPSGPDAAHATLRSPDPGGGWCEWDTPQRMTVQAVDRSGYVPAYLGFRDGDAAFPPGALPGSAVDVFGFNRRFALTWNADVGALYVPRQALGLPNGCGAGEPPPADAGGPWCTWWAPTHVDLATSPPAYLGVRAGDPWYPTGLPQPAAGGVGVFGLNRRWVAVWTALGAMYLPRADLAAGLECPTERR
jgi:predicted small lipoprotein YifL